MESIIEFAPVAGITVICALVGSMVKLLSVDTRWIPCVCGFCGAALGVLAWYAMPDYPANDIISAIATGVVSGLASTGAHQVYKQLKDGD